jgi:hypothetical protein
MGEEAMTPAGFAVGSMIDGKYFVYFGHKSHIAGIYQTYEEAKRWCDDLNQAHNAAVSKAVSTELENACKHNCVWCEKGYEVISEHGIRFFHKLESTTENQRCDADAIRSFMAFREAEAIRSRGK